MTGEASLLAVEDHAGHLHVLVEALRRMGYAVETTTRLAAGECMSDPRFDLVLLSASCADALALCTAHRRPRTLPMIVVATADSSLDVAEALDAGADAFLHHPWRPHEINARIRSVLRRRPAVTVGPPTAVEVGDVTINSLARTVALRGRALQLPNKEFQLLWLLATNAGRVVTRRTLVTQVWSVHMSSNAKTLDVHIRRLREKLELDVRKPQRIMTVRGVGFLLEPVAEVVDLRDLVILEEPVPDNDFPSTDVPAQNASANVAAAG